MTTKPEVRRFNALLESCDTLTGFRYDSISNIAALLYHFGKEIGHDSTYVRELTRLAKEIGYEV